MKILSKGWCDTAGGVQGKARASQRGTCITAVGTLKLCGGAGRRTLALLAGDQPAAACSPRDRKAGAGARGQEDPTVSTTELRAGTGVTAHCFLSSLALPRSPQPDTTALGKCTSASAWNDLPQVPAETLPMHPNCVLRATYRQRQTPN